MQEFRNKDVAGARNAVSFSDDDDATQLSGSKSAARGRKAAATGSHGASQTGKTSTRGRGRGRGRGKASTNMKQTTLDASLGFRRSQRYTSLWFFSIALLVSFLFGILLSCKLLWSLTLWNELIFYGLSLWCDLCFWLNIIVGRLL